MAQDARVAVDLGDVLLADVLEAVKEGHRNSLLSRV